MTNRVIALETTEASITTATITIKTLQVSKKQMTQSLFRQLPEATLVDEEHVRLLGVPWGHVNYHWGNINQATTHFVFQTGTQLFRCPFRIRESRPESNDLTPKGLQGIRRQVERLIEALHLSRIIEGWRPQVKKAYHAAGYDDWQVDFRSPALDGLYRTGRRWDLPKNMEILRVSWENFCDYPSNYGGPWKFDPVPDGQPLEEYLKSSYEKLISDKLEEISDLAWRISGRANPGSDVIRREIKDRESEALDYCRRWDQLMDQLRTVEQLFIAA